MPQLTKKRKAALLRWVARKKGISGSIQDTIRSSTLPTSTDSSEIAQPDNNIEDQYCNNDEIPGSSFHTPTSDSDNASFAWPSDVEEDTILVEERFHTNNVAELPLLDLDTLPLPQLPFDDMFLMDWLMVEEARNDQLLSVTCAAANESFSTFSGEEPVTGIGGRNFLDANNFSIESVPRSPLLATSNEVNQLLRVSPPPVPGEVVGDEDFSVPNDSTETKNQVSPISPRFSVEKGASSSPHIMLDGSNISQISCSSDYLSEMNYPDITEHSTSSSTSSLNSKQECTNENSDDASNERFAEIPVPSRRINLTRSNITIIDIPGRPTDSYKLKHLDCYCAACIKYAEFQLKQQADLPENNKSKHVVDDDDPTKNEMLEIYEKLEGLVFPTDGFQKTAKAKW